MEKREILQRDGLNKWVNAKHIGILQWATGVGKSYAAILAIEYVLTKVPDGKILIVCPTHTVIANFKKEFRKFKKTKLLKKCKFICYNSLLKEVNTNYALTILDEIHHIVTDLKLEYLKAKNYRSLLGLTASLTPVQKWTLFPYIRVVDEKTLADVGKQGFVSDFTIINIPILLTDEEKIEYDKLTDKINTTYMHFSRVDWGSVNKRSALLYSAKNKIQEAVRITNCFPNKYGLLFSLTVNASEEIAETIGEKCIAIHSKLTKKEKERRFKLLLDGRTKISLASVPKLFDEGVTIPRLEYGILLARYSKERQFIQTLGRLIRNEHKDKHAFAFRIYVKDTVEEKWVESSQKDFNVINLSLNVSDGELGNIIEEIRSNSR